MKRHPDALISRKNWTDCRRYLEYHDEVLHSSPDSVRIYRTALDHWLRWATDVPFLKCPELRPVFPRYLADVGGMSVGYQAKTLEIVRAFLEWAQDRFPDAYPGRSYRDTLRPVDEYEGSAPNREIVTLEEALALAATPAANLTEERDRAAACMLFLSGARASAFCTLPLLAVNLEIFELRQWPALGVMTKNRKAGTTYLLQTEEVAPLLAVVRAWDAQARAALPPTAPWYALIDRTGSEFIAEQTPGRTRAKNLAEHLQELFQRAGLPYKSPHKFRHGFTVYASSLCYTQDEFKAVSQSLMHETVGTTDKIYSELMNHQVADLMAAIGKRGKRREDRIKELAEELFRIAR